VTDSDGELTLAVAQRDAVADVVARGEVDIHTCDQLEATLVSLAGDGVRTISLDLGGVRFIDSSGLRALVVGHKALEGNGGALLIANPSPMTARLLEITGLDALFRGDSGASD
jgi:anti-sigma B factor antagonist